MAHDIRTSGVQAKPNAVAKAGEALISLAKRTVHTQYGLFVDATARRAADSASLREGGFAWKWVRRGSRAGNPARPAASAGTCGATPPVDLSRRERHRGHIPLRND